MLRRYLALLTTFVAAQTVEIIQADELSGNDQVRYLKGNVLLQQDTIRLSCAEAEIRVGGYFQARGGTVTYIGQSGRIQAAQLTYDPTTAQLHYQNQVVATFGPTTLRTNDLFYDRRTETASYTGGGSLSDTSGTIFSRQASYHVASGLATFSQAVRLHHQSYIAQTETLVYATNTQIATFPQAVFVYDTSRAETLIAGEAVWERTAQRILLRHRVRYLTPNEKLWADYLAYDEAQDTGWAACDLRYQHRRRQDWLVADSAQWSPDTLYLRSNVAGFLFGERDTVFVAGQVGLIPAQGPLYLWDQALLCQPPLLTAADMIIYDTVAQRLYLKGQAWVGIEAYQLFAGQVELHLSNRKPDSLLAQGAVHVISLADSLLGFYQQVRAHRAEAAWDSTTQTFQKLRFLDEVEAIYYQADGPHWQGAHAIRAGILYLETDSTSRPAYLRLERRPAGHFVPIKNLLRRPLFLPTFQWRLPHQRPQWPIAPPRG